jgi:hypothetical protein
MLSLRVSDAMTGVDSVCGDEANEGIAPNAEYATETREELLYNKEKLLTNGELCDLQMLWIELLT